REPEEVPGARRVDPEGRPPLRAPRHRQDAARARRRRRGRCALLLDLRLRLRRDVRRRRGIARPRPVRAGEAGGSVHRLHGRDRRRGPPSRRRPRRRPRRARADAQPAARRDGRLRDEGQHHPDRRHEPSGHPRPGAAAPRSLRPADRRRPAGPAGSPGFTGADLMNLVNEAALLAARRGKKVIEQEELEEGIMRVLAGPEKKARLLSEEERKITAYHEMGHALVGNYLEHTDPVHKITIVSRGQALGLTISLPTEDRYLTTKAALMEQIAATLGGRAAEELVFHEVTTGAANDLEKLTHTAKQMVMRFGMSEKLGPRVLGRNHDLPFLGREMSAEPDYSEEVAKEIDDEIRRVIEDAHDLATRVLQEHMHELHQLSAILIERETIDKDQFERLLAGEPEDEVFAEETPPRAPEKPAEDRRRRPIPQPRPFPLPGATMQPPPPEPSGT